MAVCCANMLFARHTRIYGYVTDEGNRGIELVNVTEGMHGTSTNKNGYYEIVVEEATPPSDSG